MSKSFRTRKRGSLRQIGKKFPIFLKKTLPEKIRMKKSAISQRVNWKKFAGAKAVITFDTIQQAKHFKEAYFDIGPETGLTAPENIYTSANKLIITFDPFESAPLVHMKEFENELQVVSDIVGYKPRNVSVTPSNKSTKELKDYIDKAIQKAGGKTRTR